MPERLRLRDRIRWWLDDRRERLAVSIAPWLVTPGLAEPPRECTRACDEMHTHEPGCALYELARKEPPDTGRRERRG